MLHGPYADDNQALTISRLPSVRVVHATVGIRAAPSRVAPKGGGSAGGARRWGAAAGRAGREARRGRRCPGQGSGRLLHPTGSLAPTRAEKSKQSCRSRVRSDALPRGTSGSFGLARRSCRDRPWLDARLGILPHFRRCGYSELNCRMSAPGAPNATRIGGILLPECCAHVCFGGLKATACSWRRASPLYELYVNTQGAPGG
jgi:hypothetical protein